jgi:DNA methyltransferase 1-associated protein 1
VKAGLENQVYPYAKYNTALEPVQYTDEEYEAYLQDDSWTRSETDHLMQLCAQYDLRWPVIVDRYTPTPPRTVEELQQRYYK